MVFINKLLHLLQRLLLSPGAFLLFAAGLVAYNVIGTRYVYAVGSTDYWEHLAAIYAFAREPFNPPNPFLLSEQPTHLFTPFHLFWGGVARTLHLHPIWLLPVAAGVNSLLFVVGVKEVAREILRDGTYALPLALALLFFWWDPWIWSGFYNFGQLPVTAFYPFWFALSVSMILISRFTGDFSLAKVILFLLATCGVFLVHPITGSFLLIGLGVKLLVLPSLTPIQKLAWMGMLPAAVLASAALWPYFPVLELMLNSAAFPERAFSGDSRLFYEKGFQRLWPALLGLPLLIFLLVKKRLHMAALGFFAVALLYAFNALFLDNTVLARHVVFLAFWGQVGVVLSLQYGEKYPATVALFLALTLGLSVPELKKSVRFWGPFQDLYHDRPLGTYSNIAIFKSYAPMRPYLGEEAVVMAPMQNAWELPGVLGCKVVGVLHANPFMTDYEARKLATERFFDMQTGLAEREEILQRFGVTHVLVPADCTAIISGLPSGLRQVWRDASFSLFFVPGVR